MENYGGLNIRVENQAESSLCWAFASIKSLETNLALNNNVEYDFSERHLDYMQSQLLKDHGYMGRQPDDGGEFTNFENYINLEDGPVLETEVPFDSEYKTISDFEYLESLLPKVDVEEEDFIHMPSINKGTTSYTNEELKIFRGIVKEHIIQNGSLSANIYCPAIESYIDMKSPILNYQGDHIADHSISIIGWDDNFSKENFPESSRPNSDGAYIALNSYGKEWGHSGIFYISYEDKLVEESMNGVSNAKVLDVLNIYIEAEPNNTNYCPGDMFNADGMVVKAIYENEEKEIKGYAINPEVITEETEYITISYTEGNTTKTTKQKINLYDYRENIDDGVNLYYDNSNKTMLINGVGSPQIDFENYNLKLVILEDGIKGLYPNENNNLSELNQIFILDEECEINNILKITNNATVYCHKDSVAEEYCKTNNIKYYSYDNYYKCGKKAYAFLNKANKSLVISGTGELYEYNLNQIPWKQENEYINSIKIDNGITNISKKLFAENSNLEEVKLGDNVTKIGEYSFYYCTNLKKVELNDGLQNIDGCVFYNCMNLEKIRIPESVEKIGSYCFYNCISLTEINWPARTHIMEACMFYNCNSLKEIELPDEITSFLGNVFMNCTSLEKISIPKEIGGLGNWTFANCTNLKEVDFSDSRPESIGDATFNGCSSLESFIMPDSIVAVGHGVWGGCTSLNELQFSHGLSRLWSGVAQYCSSLEEIILPYGLNIIGDHNFFNATNLKKVVLPSGLEKIESMNFFGCNNLQCLIIPDSVDISEEIDLLGGCDSNPTIYCKSNSSIMKYVINNNINYEIDDIKPNLEVTLEKIGNGVTKISIIATDDNNIVGLSDYPYSFDGGETWQPEPYMEITKDATITVCARDAVGNIATEDVIVRKELIEIEITKSPDNINYIEGQSFDKTGMIVTARYDDGTSKEVTDYTVIDGNDLTVAKTNVTINYTENEITKETTQKITVTEKLRIDIRDYIVNKKGNNNYIENILPGTSIDNITINITTNGTIEIYMQTEKITDTNIKVATGMKIKITLNDESVEYIAVVKGDVTGDGRITASDLNRMKNHILENYTLSSLEFKAADFNGDNQITARDLNNMKNYILNK